MKRTLRPFQHIIQESGFMIQQVNPGYLLKILLIIYGIRAIGITFWWLWRSCQRIVFIYGTIGRCIVAPLFYCGKIFHRNIQFLGFILNQLTVAYLLFKQKAGCGYA